MLGRKRSVTTEGRGGGKNGREDPVSDFRHLTYHGALTAINNEVWKNSH